jgi:hypothetical protein
MHNANNILGYDMKKLNAKRKCKELFLVGILKVQAMALGSGTELN